MSIILRSNALRLIQQSAANGRLLQVQAVPAMQQAACISGKALRVLEKTSKPKPYDYKNKTYNYWQYLFDKTTHRFDDNSKVIKN